jgi:nucleotidyltransferase substrate binding protein (TIGR01987 family)
MSKNPVESVRWKQRFEHLTQARAALQEALTASRQEPKNRLYRIALISSFTFTYELGWKTLKDYLALNGIDAGLPRDVIKQAFHHGLVTDGQAWIDMMQDRNLIAHIYDEKIAVRVAQDIHKRYAKALEQVYQTLQNKNGGD